MIKISELSYKEWKQLCNRPDEHSTITDRSLTWWKPLPTDQREMLREAIKIVAMFEGIQGHA